MKATAQHKQSASSPRGLGSSDGTGPGNSDLLERALARTLSWLSTEQMAKLRTAASIERVGARSAFEADGRKLRFLLTGALRCRFTDTGCRRRLSYFVGPGDIVTNPFYCSPGTVRVYEAITDSSLLNIPVEAFADVVAGIPWQAFKHSVAEILRSPFFQLALLNRLRGVRGVSRLAQVLLYLAAKFGVQDSRGTILTIKVTNTDLAALTGCSRQQLIVLLGELTKRGAIARQGGQIVLNVARLKALGKAETLGRGDSAAETLRVASR